MYQDRFDDTEWTYASRFSVGGEVFALAGLAADEPFGPDWGGPDAVLAPQLLRAAPPAELSVSSVLSEAARLWGVVPRSPPAELLRSFNPATRVLAAGAGAVFALAEAARSTTGADLAAQVLLVADRPAERQLLGLAAALLGSTRRTHALATCATAADAKQAGFPYVNVVLVSDDAPAEARAAAERLARELGA
jgi:hypothetical protein